MLQDIKKGENSQQNVNAWSHDLGSLKNLHCEGNDEINLKERNLIYSFKLWIYFCFFKKLIYSICIMYQAKRKMIL